MKNLIILITALFLLTPSLIANNKTKQNNNKFVGSWVFEDWNSEAKHPIPLFVEGFNETIKSLKSINTNLTIQFITDKTLTVRSGKGTKLQEGTYVIENDKLTISNINNIKVDECISTFEVGDSFTISDGMLHLFNENLPDEYKSLGFTEIKMNIYFKKK